MRICDSLLPVKAAASATTMINVKNLALRPFSKSLFANSLPQSCRFYSTINQTGRPNMFWKWTKRIGLGLAGALTALVVGGAAYQIIGTKLDQKKYPPIGQMVDVGGYRIHLHSMGEGGPTVVLDAGAGCDSLHWSLVQPEVAKFTKVVAIDRAGNGWSDESPLERTIENIVEEMHTALHNAGIKGPYILVGHSFGGLDARLFASKYPDEVAGVVLVDSSHEELMDRIKIPEINEDLMMFLTRIGLARLAMHSEKHQKSITMFPEETRKQMFANASTTKFVRTVLKEGKKLKESSAQLKRAGGFLGDKPLTVLSAGKFMDAASTHLTQEQIDGFAIPFRELQKDLVTKSTKGKQIMIEESDHMINYHAPDKIVDAIREQVNQHIEDKSHVYHSTR